MAAENIADLINTLTPEEQDTVREFIRFLRGTNEPQPSSFLAAADAFVKMHPELLRRLAQ